MADDVHVLRKLKIRFGSLVDRPANPDAMIQLFKFDGPAPPAEEVKRMAEQDETKIAPDAAALTKQLEEAQATIKRLEDELAAKAPEKPAEEVDKSELPEPVRKRLEDLEKQVATAQLVAKAERDARVEREWIEKAQSISMVDAKTFGPILKRVSEREATEADMTEIMRVLSAASEQVDKGELFKKVTKNEPAGDSAWQKVIGLAKALREGEPKLSEAQSITQVLTSNPALYDQYLAESN